MACDNNDIKQIQGLGVSPGCCHGMAVVLGPDPDSGEDNLSTNPVVLVGHTFSPEEVLSMDSSQVCGFITGAGGATAPSGIVARGAGLPAVVACSDLDLVRNGDILFVNGNTGQVLINPSPDMVATCSSQEAENQKVYDEVAEQRYFPAETIDGLKVDVLANVDLVDAVPNAITSGAMGIGLLRSEFYYLTGDGAPSEEFLFTLYQHVLSAVAPLPVTIRTLDLSGNQQIQGMGRRAEDNPALGLKGIRCSLAEPALFKTQLRALYRASAFGKLRIVLPMISSLPELLAVKEILGGVQDELRQANVDIGDDLEIGLMIEVPATVFILSDLAREVDFFSIGMNDLIQYTLAVDRGSEVVSHLYDPLHLGLLKIISQVVQAGHDAGIHVGLCGEMAGDTAYTPVLLGLGVDWLSMSSSAIAAVKKEVRDSLAEDCESLASSLIGQMM